MRAGERLCVPFFQGLLADIEAQVDSAGALTRIDELQGLKEPVALFPPKVLQGGLRLRATSYYRRYRPAARDA
jgi:hypothetical protein